MEGETKLFREERGPSGKPDILLPGHTYLFGGDGFRQEGYSYMANKDTLTEQREGGSCAPLCNSSRDELGCIPDRRRLVFVGVHLPCSCSQQLSQAPAAPDNLPLKAKARGGARASRCFDARCWAGGERGCTERTALKSSPNSTCSFTN